MVLAMLGCSSTPICLPNPAGPPGTSGQVERALADLADVGLELCVDEVVHGNASTLDEARLVVRPDHVRADVFEAGCLALVERDGLPDGAAGVFSTSGLPPGGDVDEDRALAFARACGREAERQLGALRAAMQTCGEPVVDEAQRMVFDTVGLGAFLPSRETVWEELLRIPSERLSYDGVFTDHLLAWRLQPQPHEQLGRVALWSLDDQTLLEERVVPATFYRYDIFDVHEGIAVVEQDLGRVFLLDGEGIQELAPLPGGGGLFRDRAGWWSSSDISGPGSVHAYDPVSGRGNLVQRDVVGLLADVDGTWMLADRWRRLDGTELVGGDETLGVSRWVVHGGRSWTTVFLASGEAIISRSVTRAEPWRLEQTLCEEPYRWRQLAVSANRLYRVESRYDPEAVVVVERMVSGPDATNERPTGRR